MNIGFFYASTEFVYTDEWVQLLRIMLDKGYSLLGMSLHSERTFKVLFTGPDIKPMVQYDIELTDNSSKCGPSKYVLTVTECQE